MYLCFATNKIGNYIIILLVFKLLSALILTLLLLVFNSVLLLVFTLILTLLNNK